MKCVVIATDIAQWTDTAWCLEKSKQLLIEDTENVEGLWPEGWSSPESFYVARFEVYFLQRISEGLGCRGCYGVSLRK